VDWNAKLDWAEEVYAMLILLPIPVLAVAVLWFIAPWLHRKHLARAARRSAVHDAGVSVSEKTVGERT
jgi:hypothetical protein